MVIDNFDGPAGTLPNPALWGYDLGGGGWGNGELQTFTSDPANCSLDGNGNMAIRALKDADGNYTSARVITRDKLNMGYGTISARMKIPAGQQGIASAFWLVGNPWTNWPFQGELDILEVFKDATIWNQTIVGPKYLWRWYVGPYYYRASGGNVDLSQDFHTYWVKREPGKMTSGIDSVTNATITKSMLAAGEKWVFDDQSMYALFTVVVGNNNPAVGNPTETTQFPATMLIDWFKFEPAV